MLGVGLALMIIGVTGVVVTTFVQWRRYCQRAK